MKVVVLPEPVVPIIKVWAGFASVILKSFFVSSALTGIPSTSIFGKSLYEIV